MASLRSCYFCGDAVGASVDDHDVPADAPVAEQVTVTLCTDCKSKLDELLDHLAPAGERTPSEPVAGDPEPVFADESSDPTAEAEPEETADSPAGVAPTDATPEATFEPDDESSAGPEAGVESTSDVAPSSQAEPAADAEGQPDGEGADAETDPGIDSSDQASPDPGFEDGISFDEQPGAPATGDGGSPVDDDLSIDPGSEVFDELAENLESDVTAVGEEGVEEGSSDAAPGDEEPGDDEAPGDVESGTAAVEADATADASPTAASSDGPDPSGPAATDASATESVAPGAADAPDGESAASDGADPESAAGAGADREAAATAGSGGGGSGPLAGVSTRTYNRVVRLLQNREFPVDRAEFEALASSAYELQPDEVSAALDGAIEKGLLDERDGMLRRPA